MEGATELKPRVCFEFEVEKVIGVSSDGSYQVQWAPSWVSKFHLVGCEDLIQEFLQQQPEEDIKPETGNQLQLPCVLNEMNDRDEPELALQQQNEIKTEPEGQQRSHSSNEIADDGPCIPELNTESEIHLNDAEKDYLSSNAADFDAPDTHISTDVNSLWTVQKEIVTAAPNEHQWTDKQPYDSNFSDVTDKTPSQQYIRDHSEFSNKRDIETRMALHVSSGTATSATHIADQPLSLLSKNSLLKPTISRGKREYSCTVCKKGFSSPSHLVRHYRSHTGEKPYQCSHCDKSFSQNSNLRHHLYTHTGERPYSCTFCPYSSKQRGNLAVHMRTHSEEEPFSCDKCGYSCGTQNHLLRHLHTQH